MPRLAFLILMVAGCPGDKSDTDTPPAHTAEETGCEPLTWYPDADSDGYGDAASTVSACEQPTGTLPAGEDCDDARSDVYPGAGEMCGDGVVNDCDDVDGSIAAAQCDGTAVGPYSLSAADARYVGEAAGDYAGSSVAGAGDVNGDGLDELLVAAAGVDYGTGEDDQFGMAYLVFGPGADVGELSNADARLRWQASVVGSTVEAGDLDLDGYGDVLVGGINLEGDEPYAGGAWIVHGPLTGEVDLSGADAILLGVGEEDFTGRVLTSPGDVDADGWPDVLAGAPRVYGSSDSLEGNCYWEDKEYGSFGGRYAGAAYLELGPLSGEHRLAEATATFTGEDDGDEAGGSLSWVGDLDGDGGAELFIGASMNCEGGSFNSGSAYLFSYPGEGVFSLADADAKIMGAEQNMKLGQSLSSAGDTNGDGLDEVLVGAPEELGGSSGVVYLLQGPLSSRVSVYDSDATLTGEASGGRDDTYYRFGNAMASAGDLNNDSFDDIAISAPFFHLTEYGSAGGGVFVFLGPLEGTYEVNNPDILFMGTFDEAVGMSMAQVGDVDADGLTDLLVGAYAISDHGENTGGGYLLLGGGALMSRTTGL